MLGKPKVGDRVVLNQLGFDVIRPRDTEGICSLCRIHIVAEVGFEVVNGVWDIELEGPLAKYIVCSAFVDPAPESK